MIKAFLTGVIIVVFVMIFLQDNKDRLVYWFLYPIVGILSFIIEYLIKGFMLAAVNSLINLLFISIILLAGFGYTLIRKTGFLNKSIGSGDILLFIFLAFSFSSVPFIVLFVFSLFFALLIHLFIKSGNHASVPLAGYMSLFFAAVYLISFFIPPTYLYS